MITEALAAGFAEHGTFTEYVNSVLGSEVVVMFVVMAVFGVIGVFANWFWKWLSDQITGSLWFYLVKDHWKRTLASLVCIGAWAFWAVDPSLTWTQAINLALTTGFAIDVIVNKATAKTQQS